MGIAHKKPKDRIDIFKFNPKGLTKEDIDKLQEIEASLPFKTIKIQQTLSFAPFLFLGVIIIIFKYAFL